MEKKQLDSILKDDPVLQDVCQAQETVWINPDKINSAAVRESREPAMPDAASTRGSGGSEITDAASAQESVRLTMADILDAEERLKRFAPLIEKLFPETADCGGVIESGLVEVPSMKEWLDSAYGSRLEGKLLLKLDSHLPIAGSVKARGGIYEVLKHTEELAFENGILREEESYEKLAGEACRKFFGRYKLQVGSTGNLGLSIGIMGAAIGYRTIVHMSKDARQWKKDLLKSHGVTVIEYESDYSEAVKNGRKLSDEDPMSYFVDDENSVNLFLGYAVAALRLEKQLKEKGVLVDEDHPLFVYLPCGVGGAPGGICFGLKQVYQDAVHCFFAEPVQAPCMLAGMATGLNSRISVQDIGLTGRTDADGLAVGRPSGFVGRTMKPLLSGEFTVKDERLYEYMKALMETEGIFAEPSACAAFQGPAFLERSDAVRAYLRKNGLENKMHNAAHLVWATGGSLVPEKIRKEYLEKADI